MRLINNQKAVKFYLINLIKFQSATTHKICVVIRLCRDINEKEGQYLIL